MSRVKRQASLSSHIILKSNLSSISAVIKDEWKIPLERKNRCLKLKERGTLTCDLTGFERVLIYFLFSLSTKLLTLSSFIYIFLHCISEVAPT